MRANAPPSTKAVSIITPIRPNAYSTPRMSMSRLRALPARNATASTVGIGNLPNSTSRVAAIKPKVAAGISAKAMKLPNTGMSEQTDITVMKMKNKPVKARG